MHKVHRACNQFTKFYCAITSCMQPKYGYTYALRDIKGSMWCRKILKSPLMLYNNPEEKCGAWWDDDDTRKKLIKLSSSTALLVLYSNSWHRHVQETTLPRIFSVIVFTPLFVCSTKAKKPEHAFKIPPPVETQRSFLTNNFLGGTNNIVRYYVQYNETYFLANLYSCVILQVKTWSNQVIHSVSLLPCGNVSDYAAQYTIIIELCSLLLQFAISPVTPTLRYNSTLRTFPFIFFVNTHCLRKIGHEVYFPFYFMDCRVAKKHHNVETTWEKADRGWTFQPSHEIKIIIRMVHNFTTFLYTSVAISFLVWHFCFFFSKHFHICRNGNMI